MFDVSLRLTDGTHFHHLSGAPNERQAREDALDALATERRLGHWRTAQRLVAGVTMTPNDEDVYV